MLTTLTDSPRQIALGDRVTFDTDEGYQAGTVNDLRRDVGNGELHAWVELDHQWPGMFCAVPIRAIQTVAAQGPSKAPQKLFALQRRVDVMGALAAAAPEIPVFASSLAKAKMDLLNFNATDKVAA